MKIIPTVHELRRTGFKVTVNHNRVFYKFDPQTGKKLELEDILAVGTEGNLPFDLPEKAVYVVVPAADLRDRRAFGWFLRMSEEQIMESDLVIRYLLEEGMKPVPVPSSVPVLDRA
jgi:hypothetical protein